MCETPLDVLLDQLDDLRAWCVRRSGDVHLAEDVVQETALAALTRLDTIRDPERVRGFLFRIAQRRLADATRRRPVVLPLEIEPLASRPPPRNEQRAKRLRSAVRRLPKSLRLAVRLYYLEGRPVREVAVRLDTSVNGIKARLYRARRMLREAELQ